jgi:hypothetical protein
MLLEEALVEFCQDSVPKRSVKLGDEPCPMLRYPTEFQIDFQSYGCLDSKVPVEFLEGPEFIDKEQLHQNIRIAKQQFRVQHASA